MARIRVPTSEISRIHFAAPLIYGTSTRLFIENEDITRISLLFHSITANIAPLGPDIGLKWQADDLFLIYFDQSSPQVQRTWIEAGI